LTVGRGGDVGKTKKKYEEEEEDNVKVYNVEEQC